MNCKMSRGNVPATMRAAIATGFGDVDENIYVRDDWPTPTLMSTITDGTWKKKNTCETCCDHLLLVRVLSCALAPGDVRVLSGKTDYVQMPSSGHPFVVGSDISGIVVETNCSKFAVGDYVVSRFELPSPNGGVADYRVVKSSLTEKCPLNIPPTEACGLPASAMAAKRVVRDNVKENDRVLVIGGSGAVGSSILQYAKYFGASFLAAVSTQEKLCTSLGADRVIDYRVKNWWEEAEFCTEKSKFDVVFDLVDDENWEKGASSRKAIKSSGTYVSVLPGVQTEIEVHGVMDLLLINFAFVTRFLWSRLHPSLPRWVVPEGLKLEDGDLKGLLKDVEQKRLQPVLDPASPFNFTEKGVRDAFRLQKSCHAHGKVVIKISSQSLESAANHSKNGGTD